MKAEGAARTIHEFTPFLKALNRCSDEIVNAALLPAGGDVSIVVKHAAVISPLGSISVHAPAFTDLPDLHPVEDICVCAIGVVAGGMLGVSGSRRLSGAVLFVGLLGGLGGLHCGRYSVKFVKEKFRKGKKGRQRGRRSSSGAYVYSCIFLYDALMTGPAPLYSMIPSIA